MTSRPFFIQRLKSFSYAWNGLKTFVLEEPNARIHVLAAVVANAFGYWRQVLPWQWVAIWLCIALVITTEIINTSIETLCDHVSPESNPLIKKSKDLAAAAVLVSAIVSVVVAFFIFVN